MLTYELKNQILNTAKQHGIPWEEDPTNADINLTPRNAIRRFLNQHAALTVEATKLATAFQSLQVNIDKKVDEILKDNIVSYHQPSGTLSLCFSKNELKKHSNLTKEELLLRCLTLTTSCRQIKRSSVVSLCNSVFDGKKLTIAKCLLTSSSIKDDTNLQLQISRQPFSKAELKKKTITINPDRYVLWDHRFWIKYSCKNTQTTLILRPLLSKDLNSLKGFLSKEEFLKFCKQVPGHIRFTIPVLSEENDKLVGIPTFGFNFRSDIISKCLHKFKL